MLQHIFRCNSHKMTPTKWVIVATISNTLLYNGPLYSYALKHLNTQTLGGVTALLCLTGILALLTATIFLMLSVISAKLSKALFILVILINSIALYFIEHYHVLIDRTMIGNILNTRSSEAVDFFHLKLILYFVLFGCVPALILSSIKPKDVSRLRLSAHAVGAGSLCVLIIYLSSSTWLWFDKNAKQLGGLILPWSYVSNLARHVSSEHQQSAEQILLPDITSSSGQKTVVVLIIGESARAQNFSLYGYTRQTNPLLSKVKNLTVFKNAESCATYTTASLACMLSHQAPESMFSSRYEPLPSYLQRNGVDVIWRTNNWGEPPIQVGNYVKASQLKKSCTEDRCNYDEVLLEGLEEDIRNAPNAKTLIVLHQSGSHGPAYSTKYPAEFELFSPSCKSVDLSQCSPQQLINAYDNTIVYTDFLINKTIELLERFPDRDSMLMYVSDHGESLGEHGLYLHGTPKGMAPQQQIDIPFLTWASDSFLARRKLRPPAIPNKSSYTHANVFHSVMGALGLHSDIYNSELDVFEHSDH